MVFSFGLPLCKLLQKEQMDLKLAVSLAKDIIGSLEEIRRNCDSEFNKLFLEAKVSLLVYNLFILCIVKYNFLKVIM